jgi:hypothetical protein
MYGVPRRAGIQISKPPVFEVYQGGDCRDTMGANPNHNVYLQGRRSGRIRNIQLSAVVADDEKHRSQQ